LEIFILKKLNVVEVKEQYQVKISNRFAPLENLYDDVAWESIRENIIASTAENLGYYESK
jgi:hypothetical protein